jgi:hypothetical protein
MRSALGSDPNSAQGNPERAGTVASDLLYCTVHIVLIPGAPTIDQDGGSRMDRQAHGITQSCCCVEPLQDSRRGPRHFLRRRERVKDLGSLQKEMAAYSGDTKTAIIKFAREQMDFRWGTIKNHRPARFWAMYPNRNRHVLL